MLTYIDFDPIPDSSSCLVLFVVSFFLPAHASTVFQNKLWVTGGKSQYHQIYNLRTRNSENDVWYSEDGAQWYEVKEMTGDFFAQNEDVKQPGRYAPWYSRYGHTLDALDVNEYGYDVMVQLGGFAPQPMNDQWVTENGINWVYCGEASWPARAFHATTTFNKKLYLMGGTPLNNEVWVLDSIELIPRTTPLTRVGYVNYTYSLSWTKKRDAPWSPRVGFGLLSHYFYNETIGETEADNYERMVFIGGFGGWIEGDSRFNGQTCRDDVWVTTRDSSYQTEITWTRLIEHAYFGPRAWFGLALWRSPNSLTRDVTLSASDKLPRMWLFGGGNIGSTTEGPMKGKVLTSMYAHADAYWSRDALSWTKINFEEGGGSTFVPFYSTEAWTETIVDGRTEYLGLWGHTVEYFDSIAGSNLFMMGGAYGGRGPFSQESFSAKEGIFCDLNGETCSSNGVCGNATTGCECGFNEAGEQTAGEYCETFAVSYEEVVTEEAICFAGSEIVLLESGARIFVQDVNVGDRVLSADRQGHIKFSPIISIPHAENNLKAVFHEITTVSGYQVRMSPRHIIPVGLCDDDGQTSLPLVTALQAEVGLCIYNWKGAKEQIMSNRRVYGEGIYSFITEEELVVVGGIVASPFAFSHHIPSKFYDLYRLGYRLFPQLFRSKFFITAHQIFSESIKLIFDHMTSGIVS